MFRTIDADCCLTNNDNKCASECFGSSSRMPYCTHRSRRTTFDRNVQVCGRPKVDHSHTSERTGNKSTRMCGARLQCAFCGNAVYEDGDDQVGHQVGHRVGHQV